MSACLSGGLSRKLIVEDRLFMSGGLSHRDNSYLILGFAGNYYHDVVIQQSQRNKSFFTIVETAILERDGVTAFNDRRRVIEVQPVFFQIGGSFLWIVKIRHATLYTRMYTSITRERKIACGG